MRFLLLTLLILSTAVQAQISLAPGVKMPGTDVKPVLKSPAPSRLVFPPKDYKEFRILTFADAYSHDFLQTLRLMESIERKYVKTGEKYYVTAQTVVKNSEADLKKVLQSLAVPFQLNLGVDNNGKTFRAFSAGIASLPYTFISQNGAIAWSGHPVEIESVLDALIDGKFSVANQRKIAVHRAELQSALRSGLPDVVAQTADKILTLSPRDSIAMQARLYSFQLKRQPEKAVQFLADFIKKNPENSMQTRMMLLNLLQQTYQESAWETAVAETTAYAMKNPFDSLKLASYLLTLPIERFPAAEALKLAENAEKQMRNSVSLPDALETLARANYAVCKLEQAIQKQTEAVKLRETQKSPYLPESRKMLNFYKNLKKL